MAVGPLSPLVAASSLVPLVLLLSLFSPPRTTAELVLLPGGSIQAGRALYDLNRNYRLIQQWNCDFAMYDLYDIAWNAGTTRKDGHCRTTLSSDGILTVFSGSGKRLWSSTKSIVRTPHYVLAVQPDRNVVIYSQIVWSSVSSVPYMSKYQYDDQVLLPNDTILFGKYLTDLDLNYQFLLQENCDMVLYDKSKRIWSTGTAGRGLGCTATLTTDGHLVIKNNQSQTVWRSVNHSPYRNRYALILQPDRDIVIATGPVWSTGTKIRRLNQETSSAAEEEDRAPQQVE